MNDLRLHLHFVFWKFCYITLRTKVQNFDVKTVFILIETISTRSSNNIELILAPKIEDYRMP